MLSFPSRSSTFTTRTGASRTPLENACGTGSVSASAPPETLRWDERIPKLDSLPDVEADEMARGIFSGRAARDRRRSSVTELLRVVLASRLRDTGAIGQIDRARMAARRLFPAPAQPSSVSTARCSHR